MYSGIFIHYADLAGVIRKGTDLKLLYLKGKMKYGIFKTRAKIVLQHQRIHTHTCAHAAHAPNRDRPHGIYRYYKK